jgi:hypothetical protein
MIKIVGLNSENKPYNMQIKIDIKKMDNLNSKQILKISKNYIINIGQINSFSFIKKIVHNEINLNIFGFSKGKKKNISLNELNIEKELFDDIIIIANKGGDYKPENFFPIDKEMYSNLVKNIQEERDKIKINETSESEIGSESESESESEYVNSEEDDEKEDNEYDNYLNENSEINEEVNLNKLLCKKTIKKKRVCKDVISSNYEDIINIIGTEKNDISDIGSELEEEDYEY